MSETLRIRLSTERCFQRKRIIRVRSKSFKDQQDQRLAALRLTLMDRIETTCRVLHKIDLLVVIRQGHHAQFAASFL